MVKVVTSSVILFFLLLLRFGRVIPELSPLPSMGLLLSLSAMGIAARRGGKPSATGTGALRRGKKRADA